MLILDDLLALSVKGFFGIFKKIHEMAEDELYSEDKIQEQLLGLQELYSAGEIEKHEFEQKETELLERLEAARERESGGEENG